MSQLNWYNNNNSADVTELMSEIDDRRILIVIGRSSDNVDTAITNANKLAGLSNSQTIITNTNNANAEDYITYIAHVNNMYSMKYVEEDIDVYSTILTYLKENASFSISNTYAIIATIKNTVENKIDITKNLNRIYACFNFSNYTTYKDIYNFIVSNESSAPVNGIVEEYYADNYKIFYSNIDYAANFYQITSIYRNSDEFSSLIDSLKKCNYRPVFIWMQNPESDAYTYTFKELKDYLEQKCKECGIFCYCVLNVDTIKKFNNDIKSSQYSSKTADNTFYSDTNTHLLGGTEFQFFLVKMSAAAEFSIGCIEEIYGGVGAGWESDNSTYTSKILNWITETLQNIRQRHII